jgi:hypothetical protein
VASKRFPFSDGRLAQFRFAWIVFPREASEWGGSSERICEAGSVSREQG